MKIYTITTHFAYSGTPLMSFYRRFFENEQKYMFLLAFGIITFVALVFLRFLIELCFGIYAALRLKKLDPEGWERFKGYKRGKVYKKWLKGEYSPDDIYCKLYKKFENFGNLCLIIWLIILLTVASIIVVPDIF